MARLMSVAYNLRLHRFAGWSLERWGITLSLGAAALIVLQWLVRGRPSIPWWHWLVLAALVAAGLALAVLGRWAAGRSYVLFTPGAAEPPQPQALDPRDKVSLRATGRFVVEERAHFFANLLAYWRTFASREHAVMAKVDPSRYLVVGHSLEEHRGLWYIFATPTAVRAVTPGTLAFGAAVQPALRLDYNRTEERDGKRPPRVVAETAYLAFADEAARVLVWADLLAG